MSLINNSKFIRIAIIILIFALTQQVRGQEVAVCRLNDQCSNVSGDYIDRAHTQGTLTLDNVTLNGIRPAYNADDSSYVPIVIALGTKNLNFANLGLNADNLIIDTASPYNNHARAIALGSNLSNETITANLENSNIKLTNNNAPNRNTIGILFEADTTGQIYNLNLKDTVINISSIASGNTVGAVWAYSGNGFKEANFQLENSALISSSLNGSAYGIRTENKGNPQVSSVFIQNDADSTITVDGYTAAYGIAIDTIAKDAVIKNQANIHATSIYTNSSAYGISSKANKNTVNLSGEINATGGNAYGVSVSGQSDQIVDNTATIIAQSISSNGSATGILANTTNTSGDVLVYSSGDITAKGYDAKAISVDSRNNSTIEVSRKVEAVGVIGQAIYSNSDNSSNIHLFNGADVKGGSGTNSAGIKVMNGAGNQQLTFDQGSQITSLNDLAISSQNYGNGSTIIDNAGIINGYSSFTGSANTKIEFNNLATGMLNLKHFDQGNKEVITYSFAGAMDTVFNNAGTIKFADENFDNQSTHAIFDVATFNNSGVIDLTGKNPTGSNTLVGDTFLFNGNYVSQGGSVFLNTLIDDAQSNGGQGLSDLLIVNGNVTTGSNGATKLYIIPTANSSLGAITMGDGIKVVEVHGSSDDAFVLGRPLTSGTYEYTLNKGATNNNWYLSNKGLSSGVISYNPAIGSYLANQTASIQMFQQSLFDRLTASSELINDASKPLFWLRTKLAHSSYDSFHANFSNHTRTYSAQMGGDIKLWALEDGGYFHLGLMAGYGDFSSTSRSRLTTTKTDGDVKGYSAGVYGTYFANQDTNLGLYVDLWSQMSWYRNKVSGKSQVQTQKYNSNLWSNSIEVGYGINLAKSGDYQWMVTPQVQLTYNYYDANNLYDKNQLHVSKNNASGLDSRVGFRFHARGVEHSLLEPFLEVNWLSSTAKNTINFDNRNIKDGFAKNRLEAKIGLQGNINQRLSTSVQFGGQWGDSNGYKAYQGQLNINYKF